MGEGDYVRKSAKRTSEDELTKTSGDSTGAKMIAFPNRLERYCIAWVFQIEVWEWSWHDRVHSMYVHRTEYLIPYNDPDTA